MKYLFALIILVWLTGCSVDNISNIQTGYPEGKVLYKSKCAGCHRLYDRDKYTTAEWKTILPPMQKKALITDDQREKIFLFLTENKNDEYKK